MVTLPNFNWEEVRSIGNPIGDWEFEKSKILFLNNSNNYFWNLSNYNCHPIHKNILILFVITCCGKWIVGWYLIFFPIFYSLFLSFFSLISSFLFSLIPLLFPFLHGPAALSLFPWITLSLFSLSLSRSSSASSLLLSFSQPKQYLHPWIFAWIKRGKS